MYPLVGYIHSYFVFILFLSLHKDNTNHIGGIYNILMSIVIYLVLFTGIKFGFIHQCM